MQSVSSRICTRVAVSISYDDNHYTTGTSLNIGNDILCLNQTIQNDLLWGSIEKKLLIFFANEIQISAKNNCKVKKTRKILRWINDEVLNLYQIRTFFITQIISVKNNIKKTFSSCIYIERVQYLFLFKYNVLNNPLINCYVSLPSPKHVSFYILRKKRNLNYLHWDFAVIFQSLMTLKRLKTVERCYNLLHMKETVHVSR